mmetsp:Transcript_20471/g.51896  ORF Transcript_20471/g.51896 Transcript_20471/m.51896 type:complete len:279 (+) Transcript_20471:1277-2113(+)
MRMTVSNMEIPAALSKCRCCSTHACARRNSSFIPKIHRLSRQSTSVAPSPSQLCERLLTGLSSSMPHAYLSYARHARLKTLRTCSRRTRASASEALTCSALGLSRAAHSSAPTHSSGHSPLATWRLGTSSIATSLSFFRCLVASLSRSRLGVCMPAATRKPTRCSLPSARGSRSTPLSPACAGCASHERRISARACSSAACSPPQSSRRMAAASSASCHTSSSSSMPLSGCVWSACAPTRSGLRSGSGRPLPPAESAPTIRFLPSAGCAVSADRTPLM